MEKKHRTIVHIDIDCFFPAVEELNNPKLKGKPVIVAGRNSRSVVSSSNYEARKYGVYSAMPVFHALKLCPHLVIVPYTSWNMYAKYSDRFFEILREKFTKKIEVTSLDEAYLDVSDIIHKYSSPMALAQVIQKLIKSSLRLNVSVGISFCKSIAKIATDLNKPFGITMILENELERKLWPLGIKKIPFVGAKTALLLERVNILTIKDFIEYKDQAFLGKLLGKTYFHIKTIIDGKDEEMIVFADYDPKSVSISHTLPTNLLELNEAKKIMNELIDELYQRMNNQGVFGFVVSIQLKDNHFDVKSAAFTSSRPLLNKSDIMDIAMKLLESN